MVRKNSPEKLLKKIATLDPVQFLGVCKILGVKIYEDGKRIPGKKDDEPLEPRAREFTEIWYDLCDEIAGLNRIRRRNLAKLINAATKKGE